jgi:hypothetical protein
VPNLYDEHQPDIALSTGPGEIVPGGYQPGGVGRARFGLLARGRLYGRQIQRTLVDNSYQEFLTLKGVDPGDSCQLSLSVDVLNAPTPYFASLGTWRVTIGSGAGRKTVLLTGDQSVQIAATDLIVETGALAVDGTVTLVYSATITYGSSSCKNGARWRSAAYAVAAGANVSIPSPSALHEVAIHVSDPGASIALTQRSGDGFDAKENVTPGAVVRVVPGCRAFLVANTGAAPFSVVLGGEVIL